MSDVDSDEEGVPIVNPSARYEELLRPCRDLTANWNVDIVAKLSEYLAELNIDIDSLDSSEFNRAQVNFQHAALVIEGGTCVYSRKVDYLYSLAFAAADMIFEARGRALPSKNAQAQGGPGEDDADGTPVSDEIDFLLLDDVLEKEQPDKKGITLPARDLSDDSELQRARDANRLVSVPLHLLPPGPQQRRRQSCANQNTTGLRMPDATINIETGALILDGIGIETGADLLARFDPLRPSRSEDAPDVPVNEDAPGLFHDEVDDCGDDDFGDDEDNKSFSSGVENVTDANQGRAELIASARNATSAGTPIPQPLPGDSFARGASLESREEEEVVPDPYEPLDPHDSMGISARPARRGKTWMKPKPPSALKTSLTFDPGAPPSLCERFVGTNSEHVSRSTNRFVSFPEILEQYKARGRLLSAAKRRRTQLQRKPSRSGMLKPGAQSKDSVILDGVDDFNGDIFADAGGSDVDVAEAQTLDPSDVGVDNDDFSDGDNGDLGEGGFGGDFPELPDVDEIRSSVGGLDGEIGVDSDEADRRVELIAASYEEACRKYLIESSVLWAEHAADTQLEQRVADWRSRIEPLLCLEEERKSFDIKQYGSSILQRFEDQEVADEQAGTDMGSLFASSETFEVCRSFLATLQLVNSYKIDIISPGSGDANTFNPRVKLLVAEQEAHWPKTPTASRTPNRTPAKARPRALQAWPQPLAGLSSDLPKSPTAKTPVRSAPGKRNRQAGTTPASARRVPSKARTGRTPRKSPPPLF